MPRLTDSPVTMFVVTLVILWLCARAGALLGRYDPRGREAQEEMSVVLAATLTLLGLIVGFSFSMATERYDLRKNYEEAEANAIGTEYLRAELLPASAATHTRALLRTYLAQRILFYNTRDASGLAQINARTAELQNELWAAAREAAGVNPTAVMALVVSGMNDVLNSQGYTQAAWWNRIPRAAWALMALIAVVGNLMVGFTAYHPKSQAVLLSVLPLLLAIAFFLIADIDSPRGGVIHVSSQNLRALASTLN